MLLVMGAASFGGSAPVFAQGRGHGPPPIASHGPKQSTNTQAPANAPPPASPSTDFEAATDGRQQTFGSWLDNAEINAPGEAWMSLSSTYWRSSSLREVDAPSIGASIGIAPRGQFSVSVPYYHVSEPSGPTFHGFGATYLTGKFALLQGSRVRAAVSPTLEVLSWSAADIGTRRVNVVLPLSVQTDAGAARVYGSAGYFSRGSVFGAAAAEWAAGRRTTLVASLSHSYSVKSDPVADALAAPRHRTDASGGLYVGAGDTLVFFASVGRTLSPVTETSGRLSLTGGVTVNVAGPAQHTPRYP